MLPSKQTHMYEATEWRKKHQKRKRLQNFLCQSQAQRDMKQFTSHFSWTLTYPWRRQHCSLPKNRYAAWLYLMLLLVQVLFSKPTVFAFPPFYSLVHILIIFHLRTFWTKCFRFLLFPPKLRQRPIWSLLSDHISLELFPSWILKAPFISHSLFSSHSLSVQSICSRGRPEWYISTEHAL